MNNVTFLPWVDPHETQPGEPLPTAGNVDTPLDVDCDHVDFDGAKIGGLEIDGVEIEDIDPEISSPDVETALLRALTRSLSMAATVMPRYSAITSV